MLYWFSPSCSASFVSKMLHCHVRRNHGEILYLRDYVALPYFIHMHGELLSVLITLRCWGKKLQSLRNWRWKLRSLSALSAALRTADPYSFSCSGWESSRHCNLRKHTQIDIVQANEGINASIWQHVCSKHSQPSQVENCTVCSTDDNLHMEGLWGHIKRHTCEHFLLWNPCIWIYYSCI